MSCLQHGRGLVSTMCHAVLTARVFAATVLIPIGRLDQLFVGGGIAIRHQVTRTLPAKQRIARYPPGSAVEFGFAFEKVEEQGTVIQTPLLAAPARKRLAEQLASLAYAEEVLLIGRLLIRIGG